MELALLSSVHTLPAHGSHQGIPTRQRRRMFMHTIIYDDSLSVLWRDWTERAIVNYSNTGHPRSRAASSSANTCSFNLRVNLKPRGYVRLHSDAPVRDHEKMRLQFWARGVSSQFGGKGCSGSTQGPVGNWTCHAPVCLSLWRSWAGPESASMRPLCSFGMVGRDRWQKVNVHASAFASSFGDAFDEVVLLAGAEPVELLLDDVILMGGAQPPLPPLLKPDSPAVVAAARTRREKGWCAYLSSEFGRNVRGGANASLPLCKMDGDHLNGEWVQNCNPELVKKPDRYAYGHSLPRSAGHWDYRLCYRMSFQERVRSRTALSWSWRPLRCRLREVDAEAFSRWLGARTLLFWGDSLTAQQFYALVLMLGAQLESISDFESVEAAANASARARAQAGARAGARAGPGTSAGAGAGGRAGSAPMCDYTGLGDEGGPLTVATLRHGGRIVKVMGHAEMSEQAQHIADAWWMPLWREADIAVFNIGHHYRVLDSSYSSYWKLVIDILAQFAEFSKKEAQIIFRTTNLGHIDCENSFAPQRTAAAAWAALGGREWRPPAATPTYFGQPRDDGDDKYDWRAPPLHETEWRKHAAFSSLASRFSVLNVSFVDMRSDGHVAGAMAFHADSLKSTAQKDCLHYCLPGPADSWAHALYNLLLNDARFS